VAELAPDVSIVYVSQQPAGSLLRLTADIRIAITHHYSDEAVAPGTLDAVYVPGPPPGARVEDGASAWLAHQAATAGVDILSICTGIFVCGQAGLLTKGRRVCGPKSLQPVLAQSFEGLQLVGHEYRWAVDGNLWSSGALSLAFLRPPRLVLPSSRYPGHDLVRRRAVPARWPTAHREGDMERLDESGRSIC